MTLLRPRALKKGGTIGVVSPSYAPKLAWLQRGVRALERAGFNVILDPEIDRLPRFIRAEDERRAENLMGMWLDPRVDGDHREHRRLRRGASAAASRSRHLHATIRKRSSAIRTSPRSISG